MRVAVIARAERLDRVLLMLHTDYNCYQISGDTIPEEEYMTYHTE
jgi:hypothetical protein